MIKSILFLLSVISAIFSFIPAHAQTQKSFGLIMNDSLYERSPRLAAGSKAAITEPRVSLKDFTPYPGNQGECSSCVCWASVYSALTTTWAYKQNITDKNVITKSAKSPMYIYVQVTNSCMNGTFIDSALRILKDQGACSVFDFNPQNYQGENHAAEIDPLKPIAYPYHLKDYATVFPLKADSATKVDQTRLSIANHQPVIAGFELYSSINGLNRSNYLWHPETTVEAKLPGHTMCVIGYDDYRKTFEVMNSWGALWGNYGYFEISYQDYAKLTVYGYQITIDDHINATTPIHIDGDFVIQKFSSWDKEIDKPMFDAINPKLVNNNEYVIEDELNKGDYFRVFAKNVSTGCYIYVFSLDPNNKAEVLYPFSKNKLFSAEHNLKTDVTEVPRQYSNAIVEIPGNDKVIKTDVEGVDQMCILYAYNQIDDIAAVVNKIKESSKTKLLDKVRDVLGDRVMPQNVLKYQPEKMSVTGLSVTGDIVPIILKVTVN